ncbi:MAG: ASKHA domain-containing protein [Actinomycetota bacterium]|nr:ASKHA domain-containing protein [Actinomycetota bacterium]
MPRVTFIPDDVVVDVQHGENLLRAAMMADVQVTATCGGDGTCGKCRMIVEQGEAQSSSSARLTNEQVAGGYVLGCTTEVTGDLIVRIPPEARPGVAPSRARSRRTVAALLTAEEHAARVPSTKSDPPARKLYIELPRPNLSDNADSVSRLQIALRRAYRLGDTVCSLETIRQTSQAMRDGDWNVTALVVEPHRGIPIIAGVEPGDTTACQYAVAVDIGTTTVEVALVDMAAETVRAQCSEYNRQVKLGDDVITRIIASSSPEGLVELQDLVAETVTHLVNQVCEEADVPVEQLSAYVVAGNTVMTHLLYGVSPASIRGEPYVPVATTFPLVPATRLGLPGGPATLVIAMPCPASWLGGDIVAGVLAAGIPWTDHLTLFVDIGTNGEIVLADRDWLIACSCSAGPAFEGAGILHGMRAAEGAIEQVRIDSETLEPAILTIGSVKPLGICGSGLIDCVSELFLTGALERNGRFASRTESFSRMQVGERGPEYVLVRAEDSGTGSAIVLTETDIESLMRAKAAIHAGISVLAECVDVDIEQVEEVIVAGGFGHYLDLERVMALGMLPELPVERFAFIGNGSLLGARRVATSSEMLRKAHKISEMMTYVELSVNAGFMDQYVSSLFLPHTDLTRFPRSQELLEERSAIKGAS